MLPPFFFFCLLAPALGDSAHTRATSYVKTCHESQRQDLTLILNIASLSNDVCGPESLNFLGFSMVVRKIKKWARKKNLLRKTHQRQISIQFKLEKNKNQNKKQSFRKEGAVNGNLCYPRHRNPTSPGASRLTH